MHFLVSYDFCLAFRCRSTEELVVLLFVKKVLKIDNMNPKSAADMTYFLQAKS